MADFTIWRFHQCNANFNNTFFSDVQRFLLWISAFFALFFVKVSFCPQDSTPHIEAYDLLLCGAGVFFVFIETLYIVEKIFDTKIRNLTGWILITSPIFVLYGHYGVFCPVGQAFSLAAILHMTTRKTYGKWNFFLFGLLCGISTNITNLGGGLLTPLITVLLLRKNLGIVSSLKKWMFFLLGFSTIFLPLARAFFPGHEVEAVFSEWCCHYVYGYARENPILTFYAIPVMLCFSVWPYFLIQLACKAIRYLRIPQHLEDDKTSCRISAITVWFVCTVLFCQAAATFPLLAILCALAIQNNFTGEKNTNRLIAVMNFLYTILFPVCGLFVPLIFAFLQSHGVEIPANLVDGYFAGAPLFSVVAFAVIGVFALLKRAKKISAEEREFRLNRCFAIMLAGILILLP